MKEKEQVICKINNYGANAEGVGVLPDGKIVFVPYSVKGEQVVAKIEKQKKTFVEAKIIDINRKSEFRVKPLCPYYGVCGGCQTQHLSYEESLKLKEELVQNALVRIGKLNVNILPVIASDLQYGYRNKISMPFDFNTKKLALHDINDNLICVDDCSIVEIWCKKLIYLTNKFVKDYNISVYNPNTNKGVLKQLIARKINDCLIVTLVANGKSLPNYEDYFTLLLSEFDKVGLSININTKASNYLPSNKYVYLCGEENVVLNEFGVRYAINNACFLQVNTNIKQKIYEQVLDECEGFDTAIDCYSGAGLLTALISKKVKKAYGVEIVKEATIEADKLCEFNNILNVANICGDATQELYKLKEEIVVGKTVVVLDPPRKGCDKNLLQTLNSVAPQKIIYVSCNPATLARDLNELSASNGSRYKINFVRPYDMFPQTKHIETVAVLSLK